MIFIGKNFEHVDNSFERNNTFDKKLQKAEDFTW